jgi:hypothetical protein
MKNLPLKLRVAAVALSAALAGGAATTLAQTSRPSPQPRGPQTSQPRVPQNQFQRSPDRYTPSADSRAVRDLIEDLENSSPDEVRAGRIGRFFTDPAVIITNGRMHRIDWYRLRDDRFDDRDRRDPDDRLDDRDRRNPDDRFDDRDRDQTFRRGSVRIESFETRRIDPRTVVAIYTALIPDGNSVFRQPVVATLIRETTGGSWRVASYTAENAAIPGGATLDNREPRDDRGVFRAR